MQSTVARLCYLGNVGMQLNYLLPPIIVLALTGSVSLAGGAMFIAWLPKLVLFVTGGSIVQRFSPARVHLVLELVRIPALAGLIYAVCADGSFLLVTIATTVYQCADAVWIILFERLVTGWWPAKERAAGHARMLKQIQLGSITALGLGIALKAPGLLLGLALALQTVVIVLLVRHRHALYAPEELAALPEDDRPVLVAQVRSDIQAAWQGPLVRFGLMSLAIALPYSLLSSGIVFYLQAIDPATAADAAWPSAITLVRTAASLLATLVIARMLVNAAPESSFVRAALVLCAAGAAALILGSSVAWLCVAAVTIASAAQCSAPLIRAGRQRLIGEHVVRSSRAGVTGVMTAMQSAANAVVALLLIVFGGQLGLLTLLAASAGMVGLIGLGRVRPAPSESHM